MANSELYDRTYRIPAKVIEAVRVALMNYPNAEGVRRAKNILGSGELTYQAMKRLKNLFDHNDSTNANGKSQYALAGGEGMRAFVDSMLASDREAVKRSKEVRSDMDVDVNLGAKAYNASVNLNEGAGDGRVGNAVAIIVDSENSILLLKRAEVEGGWGSGQWALVGGGVEKGESPQEACLREVREETELDLTGLVESFTITKRSDLPEYLYVCRYKGDGDDVVLNKEHTAYGWFTIAEIPYLDAVPHLMEYLTIAFKNG